MNSDNPSNDDSRSEETQIDSAAGSAQATSASGQAFSGPPQVPDHQLLRRIGGGSYGEVWLARNVMGTYRAVKIVYRKTFSSDRPYEREFTGIQKFEPISRSHEGLVDVLQVGRNDRAGYFYYVMELADDAAVGSPPSKVQSPMSDGAGRSGLAGGEDGTTGPTRLLVLPSSRFPLPTLTFPKPWPEGCTTTGDYPPRNVWN